MNRNLIFALPALALLLAERSFADTLNQTNPLSTSKVINGSGNGDATAWDALSFSFEPFDSSLGTLLTCTVTFDATCTLNGIVDPSTGGGYADAFFGGAFYIDGEGFAGGGSPEVDVSGAGGSPLAGTVTFPTFTKTFDLSAQNNDPAIISSITGNQPFVFAAYNHNQTTNVNLALAQMEYGNVSNLTVTVQSTVTVTYTYTANGAVHSTSFKVSQLSYDASSGKSSLSWSSQTGSTYSLDSSTNLTDWQVLKYGISATAPLNTFTESSAPAAAPQRFYRVRNRQ